jgi:hypothetical protein
LINSHAKHASSVVFNMLPFVMSCHSPFHSRRCAFAALLFTAGLACAEDWTKSVDIATGPGQKGPWAQNESQYQYVDDPTVAVLQDGSAAVAWVDQTRKDVFFQRLSGDNKPQLAVPVNVSRSPDTFSWIPKVALDPESSGTVYMLWQEIIFSGGSHGGDMVFARSSDGGATFSTPINISASVGGDGKGRITAKVWDNGSYDIAAGANGAVYVAWTEYDGPLWLSRSEDGGKSFSRPHQVAGNSKAEPARAPSLAIGKNGTVYLAWTTGENQDADIHVAFSKDGGGTFSKPTLVAPGKGYSDAPHLAVAPVGMLHLVYGQSAGGPFERYQVMYTRSPDGKAFETPRSITPSLPHGALSAAFPSMAIDGAGRLYVLYELFPEYRERPRGLGWSVSHDGGKSFRAPEAVPDSRDPAGGTNGSHQGLLTSKLAVSRNGDLAIVNSSLLAGRQSRIWLMRRAGSK